MEAVGNGQYKIKWDNWPEENDNPRVWTSRMLLHLEPAGKEYGDDESEDEFMRNCVAGAQDYFDDDKVAAANDDDDDNDGFTPRIGLRIQKYFDGDLYQGTIDSGPEEVKLPNGEKSLEWTVLFDDGDKADMGRQELYECRILENKKTPQTKILSSTSDSESQSVSDSKSDSDSDSDSNDDEQEEKVSL